MSNMKIPTRPAPSIEEAVKKANRSKKFPLTQFFEKKKPPPRPPPPNLAKAKSKSSWNLNQNDNTISLIEWSPPSSPKTKKTFGGSISSSFSSSTSSLASSKKSFEYEPVISNSSPFQFPAYGLQPKVEPPKIEPPKIGPTIIRAKKRDDQTLPPPSAMVNICVSPPMPAVPPPSPPKETDDVVTPFGIALYDYAPTHNDDLQLQVNDIVYLIRKVNDEWLYGRIDDKEGMFPASFVEIHVPLEEDNVVVALYEFTPQLPNDLALKTGQSVKIIKRVSDHWLWGECNGKQGQFPFNYVNRIPPNI